MGSLPVEGLGGYGLEIAVNGLMDKDIPAFVPAGANFGFPALLGLTGGGETRASRSDSRHLHPVSPAMLGCAK